ncbi:uncharacterized protein CG3556-like [Centruroides sculpturatus]|uniref:uncharacterized protein CG3556-like n=1 Tax=Centruroides sculpturatus TaxID=218467 RepID=UPI000C6D3167|nr:uncharacterized protein CG3556-like [Centruroides sculpturatus]
MKTFVLWVISLFCITNADPFIKRCKNDQFECTNGVCIGKIYWCTGGRYSCGDGSERINCKNYYPNCASDQTYCKNNRKCIPLKWSCDGYEDCTDSSDERNCLTEVYGIEYLHRVRRSIDRGHSWLIEQRRSDWGWGKDTSRAIVTLGLSDNLDFDTKDISQLMFKQLKLQLSGTLLTKGIENMEAYEIASYVHSLLAICSDPRNFQGFDLVEVLKEKMEKTESINPMVALAICNANQILQSRQLKKLELTLTKKDSPHLTETRAYAIMALWCTKNRIKSYHINFTRNETVEYNRKVLTFSALKRELTTLQNEDGSFGNLYTTAILMHAIFSMDLNVSTAKKWNVTKAINYIISQQNRDGSFGDSLATYLILPILNGRTFVSLGNINCNMIEPRNVTIQEELDFKNLPKHRVSYFIFVGQDKDIISNILLNVPVNSTFYDVMRLASEVDYKFRFKYIDYPWGKYIYSIFGLVNDAEKRNYWQLYKAVDNSTIYFEQSPDKVIPEEDDAYVYWYKPLSD